jgi:hypothetical protein
MKESWEMSDYESRAQLAYMNPWWEPGKPFHSPAQNISKTPLPNTPVGSLELEPKLPEADREPDTKLDKE